MRVSVAKSGMQAQTAYVGLLVALLCASARWTQMHPSPSQRQGVSKRDRDQAGVWRDQGAWPAPCKRGARLLYRAHAQEL
jgi:hypothetical protein